MVGWVEGGGSEIHIYTACNKEKKLSNRNVLCIMIFHKGVRIGNKTQHGESGYFCYVSRFISRRQAPSTIILSRYF